MAGTGELDGTVVEGLLRRALTTSGPGVAITDAGHPDHPLVWVNPAFERLTGYRGCEVLGRNCRFLHGPDTDPATLGRIRTALAHCQPVNATVLNYRRDGSEFWNDLSVYPVAGDDGQVTHFVALVCDAGERMTRQREGLVRAVTDPLTGLANRAEILRGLDDRVAAARKAGTGLAVLFIDLDGFKEVNDHFGHRAGDALLSQVGHRLTGAVRRGDLVGRLGGDEMLVVVSEPSPDRVEVAAWAVACHLAEALAQLCATPAARPVRASIGIALLPQHALTADQLVEQADTAMYAAKRAGGHRAALWSPELVRRPG